MNAPPPETGLFPPSVHLGAVLRAEADRQDLDEAHPSRPMHGLADSSTGDKGRPLPPGRHAGELHAPTSAAPT
jgi:hypothetical protein